MVTWLFMGLLLGGMFVGYRVNMYLYMQGAFGHSVHSLPHLARALPLSSGGESAEFERDHGVRYARSLALLATGFTIALFMGLIVALLVAFL